MKADCKINKENWKGKKHINVLLGLAKKRIWRVVECLTREDKRLGQINKVTHCVDNNDRVKKKEEKTFTWRNLTTGGM